MICLADPISPSWLAGALSLKYKPLTPKRIQFFSQKIPPADYSFNGGPPTGRPRIEWFSTKLDYTGKDGSKANMS